MSRVEINARIEPIAIDMSGSIPANFEVTDELCSTRAANAISYVFHDSEPLLTVAGLIIRFTLAPLCVLDFLLTMKDRLSFHSSSNFRSFSDCFGLVSRILRSSVWKMCSIDLATLRSYAERLFDAVSACMCLRSTGANRATHYNRN